MLDETARSLKIPSSVIPAKEAVSECSILVKVKAGEKFNRRNTLSILRIKF